MFFCVAFCEPFSEGFTAFSVLLLPLSFCVILVSVILLSATGVAEDNKNTKSEVVSDEKAGQQDSQK